MQILITFLQLAAIWLFAWVMGFAAVKLFLPEDLEREYGTLLAPCVGYMVLSFVAYTLSGSLGISAPAATTSAMVFLALAAVGVGVQPRWRPRPRELGAQLGRSLILVLPMAVVTLSPLFRFGADMYLGSVNPDFFAGMLDNLYLVEGRNPITASWEATWGSEYPARHYMGFLAISARFGGDLFGIAVEQLLHVDGRTALTLAISFFLLNLPATVYFFARVALKFPEAPARWSAWGMGISACIALSSLYFYVGQNSALPALPLLLTCVYLLLTRPGWRTLLMSALLANALFVNYFAMLPYALAPGGVLAIYLIAKRRLKLSHAVLLAVAFIATGVAVKLGMLYFTLDVLKAWGGVIGQSLQRQYFLDFLTELYFPVFMGVYNYPSNPWLVSWLGEAASRAVGAAIALALFGVYLVFVRRWFRDMRDGPTRVLVVSTLVIYAAVWAYYTFDQQYGYAVFKMTAWLQFVVVPFMAYGLHTLLQGAQAMPAHGRFPTLRRGALIFACVLYVVLNIVCSVLYAVNGAGRNTKNGYIVNHFGMSGNKDYLELAQALPRYVKPGQSVGLLFPDSIRQFWTAYYMRDIRASLLSHNLMPGDDENLADPETRTRVDYYGNVEPVTNNYFHGATDDFYLTWGRDDPNKDIADPGFKGPPVWENGSFRLYSAKTARDILYTGTGFYRLEYLQPVTTYFSPPVRRWSADGGELFLLRPSVPKGQYRIAFEAIVGYEYPSESRTLEFWRDGKKFGETVITSTARVISPPFEANPDVTRIVIAVREKNASLPRRLGIWNRSVPGDYRRMNIAFSNISALPPGAQMAGPPKLGEKLPFLSWHELAHSFDGIEQDGWMGVRARVTMAVPAGAQRVVVFAMAAGNLGLKFPMEITGRINGRAMAQKLEHPGSFEMELALQPGERVAEIAIESPQSTVMREESLRFKVLKRSMHLEALEFR
jgi:hypothetical protein